MGLYYGIKEKEAKRFQKKYAKITNVSFGIPKGEDYLVLMLDLYFENEQTGEFDIKDMKYVKRLLSEGFNLKEESKSKRGIEISQLKGKLLETFFEEEYIKGINVNPAIIQAF